MTVQGWAEDGWGPVADAFARNFTDHNERGAAVALYLDGRPMVDLWGGEDWEQDSVAAVFSVGKGAVALCANMLAEQGVLDLDAPVVDYWPEFGAEGKDDVPVRWLLTHQVGLPYVDQPLTLADVCAWDPLVHALEAQKPVWEPGTHYAYHAVTYGHLVGEVVRRATGRTVGALFAEAVAEPLGLSAWFGIPPEVEHRVSNLSPIPPAPPPADPAMAAVLARFTGPDSVLGRAATLDGAFPPGFVTADGGGLNDMRALRAEIPGVNMVADARSLARMYAACLGEVDGVRLLRPETVAAASAPQTAGTPIFGMPPGTDQTLRFGLGFAVSAPASPLLGSSFGHSGASGSLAFADTEARVAFAYVPNAMEGVVPTDPRSAGLLAAVADCL